MKAIKSKMEILAIIPARGGSKGIPKKNIRLLAGKPLLAYSIEQAFASSFVNRVVISTDDHEIGQVAEKYGAEIVWRPDELSVDMASSESALQYTLGFLRKQEGYIPDAVVFLQCTSPLTLAEDIDGTIDVFIEQDADSALAVTPFHYFLWKFDEQSNIVGINHNKNIRPLRQERDPQYLETGAVYVMRIDGFMKAAHRFFGKTAIYVMPGERCLELDEPIDFEIAEVLMRKQSQQLVMQKMPDRIDALILDFDGVFTDNKVIIFQDGTEAVIADRGDGWGIAQLKKKGLPILVLSTEVNPVVNARCKKLGLPLLQGVDDKWPILKQWLVNNNISSDKTIFVGNDVNDIECIQNVGFGVVVANAHLDVRSSARLELTSPGGAGAIREIVDLILQKF